MKHTLIYVGLMSMIHTTTGPRWTKFSGELVALKCRPTLKALLCQLDKLRKHFLGAVF